MDGNGWVIRAMSVTFETAVSKNLKARAERTRTRPGNDGLGVARGIALGLALSAVLWLVIVAGVYAVL